MGGADLSNVDVSLDSVTSQQLGLPFRMGGAGLRDPATIRKAAYLSANHSAAPYAATDSTLWGCHTRLDTTTCALREEVKSLLSTPLHVHLPPVYTPSSSQAVIENVRNSRPDKDVQSKLQSAVDKTNRESLLMISNLPKEELIRVRSVVCPNARQYMHSTFVQPSMKDVPGFVHYSHKDLTPLTNDTWCLAFCRRFGVPYARLPSTATHHSACDSCAGVNGAHAIVCPFSRVQRTWRHNRVRDALAFAARKFGFQVYTNGRRDAPTYEFPFRTDEYGVPTNKRSDLQITDERGTSYILDVTICDPTTVVCVQHTAGGRAGSMPALQKLYSQHVKTYENICDWHGHHLIPLAFDTLGRMHPDSAMKLHNAFIKHRLSSTKEQLPSRNALWRWVGRAFHASVSTAVLRACTVPACATRRSIRTSRAMAA